MGGKAKPTKHTAKEINGKIAAATQNKGGGKEGLADRKGGAAVSMHLIYFDGIVKSIKHEELTLCWLPVWVKLNCNRRTQRMHQGYRSKN